MKDNATGHSRGFGFITFADQAGADACMAQDRHEIDGQALELKPAQP